MIAVKVLPSLLFFILLLCENIDAIPVLIHGATSKSPLVKDAEGIAAFTITQSSIAVDAIIPIVMLSHDVIDE